MNFENRIKQVMRLTLFTFILVTSFHVNATISVSADKMTRAAHSFLESLTEVQKNSVSLPLKSKKYLEWRFFPEPSTVASIVLPERKGLAITSLDANQIEAFRLLAQEGVSERGLEVIDAAIELDKDSSVELRGKLNLFLFNYGPQNYFITFFGKPGDTKWAWRLEGHHISINFTIENGRIVSSLPTFIGTTINSVRVGDKSIEPLKDVASLAKQLSLSLLPEQLALAGQSVKKVPKFNPVAPSIFGGQTRIPSSKFKGLPGTDMTARQKETILALLESYQSHFDAEISRQNMASISTNDLESTELIWTGDVTMKTPFYFRIVAPHFILEFNTSEGHADHFHTAWVAK